MSQTFEQRCAMMRENGNPDPTARPVWETFPKRDANDLDARWHFTASLGVWGDLGWLKACEMEQKAENAVREAERSMSHDIEMRLRIRVALRIHDCAPLEESIVAVGIERDDLAALVGRLILRIRKDHPNDEVAAGALDYLQRHKLTSPLR